MSKGVQSRSPEEDHIGINTKLIPDYIRYDLAKATLEVVNNFLQPPGGREMLDAMATTRRSKKALKKV